MIPGQLAIGIADYPDQLLSLAHARIVFGPAPQHSATGLNSQSEALIASGISEYGCYVMLGVGLFVMYYIILVLALGFACLDVGYSCRKITCLSFNEERQIKANGFRCNLRCQLPAYKISSNFV